MQLKEKVYYVSWNIPFFFSLTEDGMLKIKFPIPEGVHKVLFW